MINKGFVWRCEVRPSWNCQWSHSYRHSLWFRSYIYQWRRCCCQGHQGWCFSLQRSCPCHRYSPLNCPPDLIHPKLWFWIWNWTSLIIHEKYTETKLQSVFYFYFEKTKVGLLSESQPNTQEWVLLIVWVIQACCLAWGYQKVKLVVAVAKRSWHLAGNLRVRVRNLAPPSNRRPQVA